MPPLFRVDSAGVVVFRGLVVVVFNADVVGVQRVVAVFAPTVAAVVLVPDLPIPVSVTVDKVGGKVLRLVAPLVVRVPLWFWLCEAPPLVRGIYL